MSERKKRTTLSESHKANIRRGVQASLAKKGITPMTTTTPVSQPSGEAPERIWLSSNMYHDTFVGHSLVLTEEKLKLYHSETITAYVRALSPDSIAEKVERLAALIVPDCLSRTCFIKDCGWDNCWGCEDAANERKRVANIIAAEFGGAGNKSQKGVDSPG